MSDDLDKLINSMNGMGDFFNYGKIPKVCIHTPIPDNYSKFYIPQDKCKCGCCEWIDGTMKIIKDRFGYKYPEKNVHRCKSCGEVRIANLKE